MRDSLRSCASISSPSISSRGGTAAVLSFAAGAPYSSLRKADMQPYHLNVSRLGTGLKAGRAGAASDGHTGAGPSLASPLWGQRGLSDGAAHGVGRGGIVEPSPSG